MLFKLTINGYEVIFILWNLILLIIPFFLYWGIVKTDKKYGFKKWPGRMLGFLLFGLWVLFIPNSAYVVADARHIVGFCPQSANRICVENAWMVMFFFSYALIGWAAFVILVNQMKDFIVDKIGKTAGDIFLFSIIPLISLGVLLGLISRFNSWDVFIGPLRVLKHIGLFFNDWDYAKNLLLYTVFYYLLYFAGDLLLAKKKINIKIKFKN